MELNIKNGIPAKQKTKCLIVPIFEGRRLTKSGEELDKASKGAFNALLAKGDIEGKVGQFLMLYGLPGILAERILLVGVGKEETLTPSVFIKIHESLSRYLDTTGVQDAVSLLCELVVAKHDLAWNILQAGMALLNSRYSFEVYKSKPSTKRSLCKRLSVLVHNRKDVSRGEKALTEALAISQGMTLAKDLGNCPPNICTPSFLAKQAQKMAKSLDKVSCAVLDEKEMAALGMGSLLSVSRGSEEPAKLITMEYRGTKKDVAPYVLVGKGITFDTGGLSLKSPPPSMVGMKLDMCGAAAIMGVLHAVATLELPINVVGVIASAENMPDGRATRPEDVVTSMSGKTIEILNTDAEGRLVLCDALTYVERFKPKAVIDIATLTGAVTIALGNHPSGLLSNSDALARDLINAGQSIHDRVWQLPLWDDYNDELESDVADLANIGKTPGFAGTILGAVFLSHFTKKYEWAHLDIAATSKEKNKRLSSGRPIPLLVRYLLDRV